MDSGIPLTEYWKSRGFQVPQNTRDNIDEEFTTTQEAILILCARWSSYAWMNIPEILKKICDNQYKGIVHLMDDDTFPTENQQAILGELGQGWGEIFIFNNGQLVKKFTQKEGYSQFLAEF